MFEKLLKKTAKKADAVIDKTAEDIGDVVADAKKLIDDSRDKLKLIATLAILGIALGITADIISIVVGARTVKLLKNVNILNN